jgi:hypothetical protein
MDRDRFDGLARLVSANSKPSRRGMLAAVLGAVAFGRQPAASPAKRRSRRRGKVGAQAKTKAVAAAPICYPGGAACVPGRGRNNSGCDFSGSTVFVDKDARGSNLSNANFRDADAYGADFRGANLSGACFVDASLYGAKLGASVNLHGAVFCRTVMPDGSIDDSGCDNGTPCCPTDAPPPQGGTCRGLYNLCGIFAGECCEGLTCTTTFAIVVTACQKVCQTDADCRPYSAKLKCDFDAKVCPTSLGKCCVPK